MINFRGYPLKSMISGYPKNINFMSTKSGHFSKPKKTKKTEKTEKTRGMTSKQMVPQKGGQKGGQKRPQKWVKNDPFFTHFLTPKPQWFPSKSVHKNDLFFRPPKNPVLTGFGNSDLN